MTFEFLKAGVPCTKDFGHGSFASVCDEGHRDMYEPIAKTNKGIVQVYTSTKSGKRFEKTQAKFNENKTIDKLASEWHIKIDRSKNYQKIIGFGASFSDAGVQNVGSMTPNYRDKFFQICFLMMDLNIRWSEQQSLEVISPSDHII